MAAVTVSASWALLLLVVSTGEAATINITNRCSFTVWPASVPGGGVQLKPGQVWSLDVPTATQHGRIWARTGCSFDDINGNGSCQTGDCSGVLACNRSGQPPKTMAEFTIGQVQGQTDFFDISLMDGFNVPMVFLPVPTPGAPACRKGPRCAANITSQCPAELRAPGGCNSACNVFKQSKYCCTGTNASCEPSNYSLPFVRMCPDAYSYSSDDSSRTMFTCPTGTNYQVVFCPLLDATSSPPNPPAPGYLAPEWLTWQITEKADIYSFGVVVMEIVSGRKNLDTSRSEESIHLITLLEEKLKSDQLVDLIDNQSNNMQVHKQEVIQMMKLAMWCLQIDCKKRPKMSEVVKVLEGTMDAETHIDHNFVATSPANFGIARNVNSSAPPLASDVSGPR